MTDLPLASSSIAALEDAEQLKAEGNAFFRTQKWDEALSAYRSALSRLPKRNDIVRQPSRSLDDDDDDDDLVNTAQPEDIDEPEEQSPVYVSQTTADEQYAKVRAVIQGNIGACYVKLNNHKEAVEACTQALKDDPTYVKVLYRRASSSEEIGTWSSLSSAQEDYNTLLELTPDISEKRIIRRKAEQLKPRLDAVQKLETAEMMDKLKSLGNSVLGNFGLSTDNFKFDPNGQGGYSLNFQR